MSWLSRVRSGIPFLPKRQSAENLWHKCAKCGTMVFVKEWEENYSVCPRCDFHDRIGPAKRFEQLFEPLGRADPVVEVAARADAVILLPFLDEHHCPAFGAFVPKILGALTLGEEGDAVADAA